MTLTLSIPDDFAAQITASGKDPARTALEALALEGYLARQLSEGMLRSLLGFEGRLEVHNFLAIHHVPLNYSLEDWQHDKQLADHRPVEASTELG